MWIECGLFALLVLSGIMRCCFSCCGGSSSHKGMV